MAPDVRMAPQARLAIKGESGAIWGTWEEDPTCIEATIPSSDAVDMTGSQYRPVS